MLLLKGNVLSGRREMSLKKKVAIHYEAYDGSSCKQEKSKY